MFGYPFLEKAIQAWRARAIFKPYSSRGVCEHPLDLLPDRQGSQGLESQSDWEKFQGVLNLKVLPDLQKLSQGFTQDSHEILCKHFEWPYDVNLVLVAQGSPNGSYGYFYLAVNLVRREDAPPAKETSGEEANRLYAARKAEFEKREAEDKERQRKLRATTRAQNKLLREKVAANFNDVTFINPGMPLAVGNAVTIDANQGRRDALVRAVCGEEALIEYWMPNGRSFFRIILMSNQALVRTVANPKKLPARWRV